MTLKEARRYGFHFRRSNSNDRIGIVTTIKVKDNQGSHKTERLNYEDLYNPILVLHHRRHCCRAVTMTSPFSRVSSPEDRAIEENWHCNRIYQAALREARDRAGAYFRKHGCWNPTREELEEEIRTQVCGIYIEIHSEF